jgi:hypothetical protein
MTATYNPTVPPNAADIYATSDTNLTPIDNEQRAISSPVRSVEELSRFIACQTMLDQGGSCGWRDMTSNDTEPIKVPLYPMQTYLRVTLGMSASAAGTVKVTSTLDGIGTTVSVPAASSVYTSPDEIVPIDIDILVQATISTPATPSTTDVTVTYTVSGTMRRWYVGFQPAPRAPGSIEV